MKSVADFFIFCSGADYNLLKRTPTDRNKYMGIGATVFFTGVLAFISSGYAIYTVFESYIAAIFFGLIWGLMIFNLDRYIVSSMKARGSFGRDFMTAFPRLLLAVLLAIVIAKPLELKIFDSEIQAELISMEQEKFKEQEDKLKYRFTDQIESNKNQIENLKAEIKIKSDIRDQTGLIAIQEADGTGGSMQRNLGPIYRAKKAEADKAQSELDALMSLNLPLIEQKITENGDLEKQIQAEITALERTKMNGFAARLDALGRLAENSRSIFIASIFITLLFIAIETSPIFVKLISPRSPYDYKLHKHEHVFEMDHKLQTSLLANKTMKKVTFDTQVTEHHTREAIKTEKALLSEALKQKLEKLSKQVLDLKEVLKGIANFK
jgi:hypothetical protein